MTFKIFFQVIAGNYFGLIAALGKDHPYLFSLAGLALQGKGGTGLVAAVAFVEIDNSFLHDLVDIFLADVAAVHAAQSVLGII